MISNSLKFSKADIAPLITIASETIELNGNAFGRIVLKDNGLGFEQKYAEKIFATFTRLHTKANMKEQVLVFRSAKKS